MSIDRLSNKVDVATAEKVNKLKEENEILKQNNEVDIKMAKAELSHLTGLLNELENKRKTKKNTKEQNNIRNKIQNVESD